MHPTRLILGWIGVLTPEKGGERDLRHGPVIRGNVW